MSTIEYATMNTIQVPLALTEKYTKIKDTIDQLCFSIWKSFQREFVSSVDYCTRTVILSPFTVLEYCRYSLKNVLNISYNTYPSIQSHLSVFCLISSRLSNFSTTLSSALDRRSLSFREICTFDSALCG